MRRSGGSRFKSKGPYIVLDGSYHVVSEAETLAAAKSVARSDSYSPLGTWKQEGEGLYWADNGYVIVTGRGHSELQRHGISDSDIDNAVQRYEWRQ